MAGPATATLTPDQLSAFKELRKTVDDRWAPTLVPAQVAWLNDRCLLRYLRARKYNVEKAKEMLKNTMNWRTTHAPAAITHKDVMEISKHFSNYLHMTTKDGNPVCYMRFQRDPPGFTDKDKLQHVKFVLEEAARVMKYNDERFPGIEKLCYIIDLQGFSLNAPGASREVAAKWTDMLQNHYPERLGKAYLINYPSIFSVFWAAVKLFIDSVTAAKVCFVSETNPSALRTFFTNEGFNPAWLEKPYGGDLQPLDRPNFIGQKTYESDPMTAKTPEEVQEIRDVHYKYLKREKRDRKGPSNKEKKEKKSSRKGSSVSNHGLASSNSNSSQ
eukprot:TRINITY_DN11439_c1_g3_i1.p1 TRINITY_DN11439_c1_g3~~TRINITY_DN11439_c1_g3_i1.p1  ORF type:complete len:329 (+),score=60.01 TRINITY_DN11439_c1_g3_i1:187-1173(+)